MTLTLELTSEQEERLMIEAARSGVDLKTYVLRRALGEDEPAESRGSLAGRLLALGALGAIEGTPRPDGRNRSEIEAV